MLYYVILHYSILHYKRGNGFVEGAFVLSVHAPKTTPAHRSYCKGPALAIRQFLAMSYSFLEGQREPSSCPCCLESLGRCVRAYRSICQPPCLHISDKAMWGLTGLVCLSPLSNLSPSCIKHNRRSEFSHQGHEGADPQLTKVSRSLCANATEICRAKPQQREEQNSLWSFPNYQK